MAKVVKAINERCSQKDILEFIETEIKEHATTEMDKSSVDRYLAMVNSSQLKIIDIHDSIQQLMPDDIAIHKTEFHALLKFSNQLYSALTGIKNKFPLSTPNTTNNSTANSSPVDVRLPQLTLPTFDGNLLDWVAFRDIFTTAVHNKSSLSKAQKLTYLKTLLTGEAARQIKSLVLSDVNYDIAWDQLTNRYQDDRELLFAIIMRVLKHPTVVANSSSSCRTLVDVTQECIRSLEVIGISQTKGTEAFLLVILNNKLDQTSKELWELTLKDSSIPPLSNLLEFMEIRARSLAASCSYKPSNRTLHGIEGNGNHNRVAHVHQAQLQQKCSYCDDVYHPLYKCPKFLALSVDDRFEQIKINMLCFNCLSEGHSCSKCSSASRCRQCNGKHHSVIHKDKPQQQLNPEPVNVSNNFHTHDLKGINQTLLATAIIRVKDVNGQQQLCRALLDGGSTSSFVTSACVQRLGLLKIKANAEVVGLTVTPVGKSSGITTIMFQPHFQATESYSVTALVLPKVTTNLPIYCCDKQMWSHLHDLNLADPNYEKSASIDILLGADIFWSLILDGRRTGSDNSPIGLRSTLGWLIAGRLDGESQKIYAHYADTNLDQQLQRFWEVDSIPESRSTSQDVLRLVYHGKIQNQLSETREPWRYEDLGI